MARVTYVTDTGGDWAALYIDGVLAKGVEQNHSLDMRSVIEALCKVGPSVYEHFEVDCEEFGGLPERLGDIPRDKRIA